VVDFTQEFKASGPASIQENGVPPVRHWASFDLEEEAFLNYGADLPAGGSMTFSTTLLTPGPGTRGDVRVKVLPGNVLDALAENYTPDGLLVTYSVTRDALGNAVESIESKLTEPEDSLTPRLPFQAVAPDDLDPALRLQTPSTSCVIL
jgi:hypothetical protein